MRIFERTLGFGAAALAVGMMVGVSGCKNPPPPQTVGQVANGPYDPADVNMAPLPRTPQRQPVRRVLGQRDAAGNAQYVEEYPQNGVPREGSPEYEAQVNAGMDAVDEADQAPPPLPEYTEPAVPRPGVVWTPGYWRHSPTGFYWVPGAWVTPPYAGALWTPGYWRADGPRYRFHPGYWGRHVGFYGGVPYGGGYTGTGYHGGYWQGDRFRYNRAVFQVNINTVPDYYDQPVRANYPYGRVSYNGGRGGIALLPLAVELIAFHERHERPVGYQYEMERRASLSREQFYEYNHGRPGMFFAPEGYERERFVEHAYPREVIVERHDEGRGHAYGRIEGGDKHEFKREEHEFKHEEKHGGGEGRGHGEGHGDEGHGHGGGEGHGHGKG